MTSSTGEFSNGLSLDKDFVFAERPADPEMRESTSVWFYEENGAFGFPRLGIEAEAANWDLRPFTANFAFPGGRVLLGSSIGRAGSPIDPDGRPTQLSAGPLAFRCIEPFKRWQVSFDGPAIDTHVSREIARTVDIFRHTYVTLEAEVTMATPPWIQDNPEQGASLEAGFMGLGLRWEQLFRAEGVFTVDGKSRAFRGSGLRIKRQSKRDITGFNGHVWQSALFPDGRAFGFCAYTPNPDGSESFNDGYVYVDGKMHSAKAVEAPWLRRLVPENDDISVVLESALGRVRIEGASRMTHLRLGDPRTPGLTFHQGAGLYAWDDQTAYGMIERSSPNDRVDFG